GRLSRSRELSLPAVERERAQRGRTEHRQLRQPGVRPPLPDHARRARRARAVAPHPGDARHPGARAAVGGALPPRVVCPHPRLGAQREAARHVVLHPQVPRRRRRAPGAQAPRVEQAGEVAGMGAARDRRRLRTGGAHGVEEAAMIVTYLLRRLTYGVVTVLGVLLLLFVLFFLVTTPDDIARRALGEKAPPEALAQWKVNHGYAKPRLWNPAAPGDTMLAEHFRRMLTFDFGRSDTDAVPITRRLREGVGPSLSLALPLFLIELPLALALALLVSFLRETYVDRLGVTLCVLGMSVSVLLYIVGGQYILGKVLRWFPISGFDPRLAVILRFLALPV